MENSTSEFNGKNKNIIELKENIEKEMNKINQSYDTVNNEITKSYEIKHEKLIKEEKDLKRKITK